VITEILIDALYKRREGDGQKDLNVAVSPDGQGSTPFPLPRCCDISQVPRISDIQEE
jgi:hypothetical protein